MHEDMVDFVAATAIEVGFSGRPATGRDADLLDRWQPQIYKDSYGLGLFTAEAE